MRKGSKIGYVFQKIVLDTEQRMYLTWSKGESRRKQGKNYSGLNEGDSRGVSEDWIKRIHCLRQCYLVD